MTETEKVVEEEENKYGTVAKLATQGTEGAATGAKTILMWSRTQYSY